MTQSKQAEEDENVVKYWQRPICKFMRVSPFTFDIFKKKRLHLNAPTNFNDPFEGKNDEMGFIEYNTLVTCFTGLYKEDGSYANTLFNPLMWSHYADNHKGICVVFDPLIAGLVPVKYGDKRTQSYDYSETLVNKGSLWSYENEQRFISNKNGSKLGRVSYEDGNFYLKFYPDDIKAIIFGCRTPEADINMVINYIFQYAMENEVGDRQLRSLCVQRLKLNPTEYRLMRSDCFVFSKFKSPDEGAQATWGYMPVMGFPTDEVGSIEAIMRYAPLNEPKSRPETPDRMIYDDHA